MTDQGGKKKGAPTSVPMNILKSGFLIDIKWFFTFFLVASLAFSTPLGFLGSQDTNTPGRDLMFWFSVQSIERKLSEVIVYYAFVIFNTDPPPFHCLPPTCDWWEEIPCLEGTRSFFCSKFRRWEEVAKGQRTLWLLLFHPKNTHRWAQEKIIQFFLTQTQLSYLPSFISM